jgi:uncharacterized membrane protein
MFAFMRPLVVRPRLTTALALGAGVGLACYLAPTQLRPSTCAIFGWDATCALFIASVLMLMKGKDHRQIQAKAANQDEGQHFILALVTIAAVASLTAIGAELSLAKSEHGWEKAFRVIVAFTTVAASWFMVQLVYALHYAHEYYALDPDGTGKVSGGLAFPGDEHPDYWDFLHFSVVIGVASQTADIAFTAKPLRRIGTFHSALAFAFNTVVLALTINLLAGLF